MKIVPRIYQTSFYHTIENLTEEEIMERGENVLQSYGQKKSTKHTQERPVYYPKLVHHLFWHPFALSFNSILETHAVRKGRVTLKYTVNHPAHIVIYSALFLMLPQDLIKILVPILLMLTYAGVILFMQRAIFRKMIGKPVQSILSQKA